MSPPISSPAPAPGALWAMSPHAFNEWRATNDLPVLFDFLAGLLPGFDDWQASLPFDRETVLRVVPTGELFRGASLKTVVRREDDIAGKFHLECVDGSQASVLAGAGHRQFEAVADFLPYFAWAKTYLGDARFFVWDKANDQRSDTFVYGSWRGQRIGGRPVTDTRATLFRGLDVLKLGETTISHVDMARNLDFADLDGLLVKGNYSGSRWKRISFSSCKNVRFVDAHPVLFVFDQCPIEDMRFESSRVQDLQFKNIEGAKIHLTGTSIYRLDIEQSTIMPFIRDGDIRELTYRPWEATPARTVASIYRALRSAYQAAGQRPEASAAYYDERRFERKALYRPYAGNSERFRLPHGGTFAEARRLYNKGHLRDKNLMSAFTDIVRAQLSLVFRRKLLAGLVRSKARWLASMGENLIWGYGERPVRILLWVAASISLYAVAYHHMTWLAVKAHPQGWVDAFYFSAVTFTTLGYGDISPTTGLLKMVCASEAMLGGLSLGLVVAGFSNRSRY